MTLASVLVTDTNIWIDLANGGILAEVFQLPYEFSTTDIALEEKIHPGWRTLLNLGLLTYGLEPEIILELVTLRQAHRQLSIVDLAAFLVAKSLGAQLKTGDGHLKKLAEKHGVSVHGVIWLLDEMVSHHILTTTQGAHSLVKMLNQGARLPDMECKKRFDSWSQNRNGSQTST